MRGASEGVMTLGDRGPAGGSSIVARRRLGIALRALREEAGKTGEQAAQALTRTGSWISRLEAGRVGVRLPELRALLEISGLDDIARRRELERLAADTVRRGRGWWSRYAQSIPESYATYIGLEDQAKSLLIYEDRVVPGLLQTAAYGRAIFEVALPPVDGDDANARVQVRLKEGERHQWIEERRHVLLPRPADLGGAFERVPDWREKEALDLLGLSAD